MGNELTGDFDMVVEFPTRTATRVLAAMHRGQRFPHSASIRVSDRAPVTPFAKALRPISARVDAFGDAIINPRRVGIDKFSPIAANRQSEPDSPRVSPDSASSAAVVLDSVVNPLHGIQERAALVHSDLEGVAQLQLAAPTMAVPDESGRNITLRTSIMARYIADPGTRILPEFMRGEIEITVSVDQVASQVGNVFDIDLKADAVGLTFTTAWSDSALSTGDRDAITRAVRNALKTAFQPSNAVLPSTIGRMVLKTFKGASTDAIGFLLNAEDRSGDRDTANSVFLADGDDFAVGAGRDFVLGTLNSAIASAVDKYNLRQFPFSFVFNYWVDSTRINYTVSLTVVKVDLQVGKIVLTIEGTARTNTVFPNFDFRVTQALTLKLAGAEAELAILGDISLTITTGGIQGWLVNFFKGTAESALRARRDQAIAYAQVFVKGMLNANTNIGRVLASLMNPVSQQAGAQEYVEPTLAYTSFAITPAGLVLHGALSVPAWPPARVDFDAILGTNIAAPDFTALLTWIPGGAIREYVWRFEGESQPFLFDSNTFLARNPPKAPKVPMLSALYGYLPICLTVVGERCSASGPGVMESVSATTCGWSAVSARAVVRGKSPFVCLARPDSYGRVKAVGHAAIAVSEDAVADTVDTMLVFPGDDVASVLETALQVIEQTRAEVSVALIAVLNREQLAKAPYLPAVTYAEDQDGHSWEHAFGVEVGRRPAIFIVPKSGRVAWRSSGEISRRGLAAALEEHLTPSGVVIPRFLKSGVTYGRMPPNFVFSYARDRDLTLRKLIGRQAILLFWRSELQPSIEMLQDLEAENARLDGRKPILLAIHQGDRVVYGEATAAVDRGSAIHVIDRDDAISAAYGINVWPTTIFLDTAGYVRQVRYGQFALEHSAAQRSH